MQVEVFLTGSTVTGEDVKDRVVVVVDVLRASATIVTALHNGARAVVPVADMEMAGKLASNMDSSSYLLGGERGGIKIEGYQAGNSPFEYAPEVVEGKTVILNTTNGTNALVAARGAGLLLVGSFLNASRVAEVIKEAGRDAVIVCAGWRNRISLEDTLCAGLLLSLLWDDSSPGLVSDAAHTAYSLYHHDEDQLDVALRRSNHAQRLVAMGAGEDVDYCLRRDALPVVPVFGDSRLTLLGERSASSFFPAAPAPPTPAPPTAPSAAPSDVARDAAPDAEAA
jgi:2-phosphosulfolactate phosphatase